MIWKKVLLLAAMAFVLALGVRFYQGMRAESEVDSLLAQARSRGLRTGMREILVSRPESGTILVRALEGIGSASRLPRLDFDPKSISAARNVVASSSEQFETIAEFANLEEYAPPRNLSSGMVVQDYSTLATAMRAEAWRGYLMAVDDKFDEAVESIETLVRFGERLQDEGLPVGAMIARRGIRDSHRIMLELAKRNGDSPQKIERLLDVADQMDAPDWKSVVEFELANGLLYIDEIEEGFLDQRKQVGFGPLQMKVSPSAHELNRIRIEVLETALKAFDTWESATLEMVDPGEAGMVMDDPLNLAPGMRAMLDTARRNERNDLAELRAVKLVLEAYCRKAITGSMPSIDDLGAAGVQTIDPWFNEAFSLHQDRDGRIWAGAKRTLRNELPPRQSKLVDVLAWQP